MNKLHTPAKVKGLALIDALISLVILAGGLMALFVFQGNLTKSAADAKARSEALQYAQAKLETMRYSVNISGISTVPGFDGTESLAGVNNAFTRTTASTVSGAEADVEVTVAWLSVAGETQNVVLESILAQSDPGRSSFASEGGTPGGGALVTPSGSARYGDGATRGVSGGELTDPDATNYDDALDNKGDWRKNTINDGDNSYEDGTATLKTQAGYELIDLATGNVLLILDAAGRFATISGRIYEEVSVDPNYIYAGAPDVSYCSVIRGDGNNSGFAVGSDYLYVIYQCYVGADWYGSIDVTVIPQNEFDNPNDRVCVGDPAVGDTGVSDSKHAQESVIRVFRGYQPVLSGNVGDVFANRVYTTVGMTEGQTFEFQHYLMSNFSSSVTCDNRMELADITISGVTANEFAGNTGKFVCMSPSCPATLPVNPSVPTSSVPPFTMTITISGASVDVVNNVITSDGDICIKSGSQFACPVFDLGTGWDGFIEAIIQDTHMATSVNPIYFSELVSGSTIPMSITTKSAEGSTTISGDLDKQNNTVDVENITIDGTECTISGGGNAVTYSCATSTHPAGKSATIFVNTNAENACITLAPVTLSPVSAGRHISIPSVGNSSYTMNINMTNAACN